MKLFFNISITIILANLLVTNILATNTGVIFMPEAEAFAGNDTSICQSAILNLSDLNASISGSVSDGNWFTTGDGFFDPGASTNVMFSIGNTYIPGPNDIVDGSFKLILVSLDPDGIGPLQQAIDTVNISMQDGPVLVCHGSLNVSLGNNCTETVTAQMLLTNPEAPYGLYTISMTDEDGSIVPDNILTQEQLDQSITFTVGHMCGSSTCWGTLTPQDKTPPVLQCANIEVSCDQSTSPDSIGLPISPLSNSTKINENTYQVDQLDACGIVSITFEDNIQDMNCLNGLQDRVIRKWIGFDESNNQSQCTQVISIRTKGLTDVILPLNYNNNPLPPLECGGNWPKLTTGYPHPDFTGRPDVANCRLLETTSTDVPFEFCGASYKLLRKWLIIDWCTNETIEHNQIIKIDDTTPPDFNLIDSIGLMTTIYDCHTAKKSLPLPYNIIDCSSVDTSFFIRDTFGVSFDHLIRQTNNEYSIDSLPVGYYIGSYVLIDECQNADTVGFKITVTDDSAPFAICDQFTKVSIINNGRARMFANSIDDNSIDNCQIDSLAVAKMTDDCDNYANVFRPYVDFCCAETAAPVMVALRVTDIYGNVNTCMSEVTVEDKEKPTLSCPSNVTISCEHPIDENALSVFGTVVKAPDSPQPFYIYDEVNNGFAGSDGFTSDNCSVSVDSSYTLNTTCNVGSLLRVFTVTDLFGNTSQCQQTISIIDASPFGYNDINWPANTEIDECDTASIDITLTKEPTFINTTCSNVQFSHKDQYFFNTNEACIKVLRKWTVIDWCNFNSNTLEGLFEYTQSIKLNNTTNPIISTSCQDTVVCFLSPDCGKERYTTTLLAEDDCTPSDQLKWSWEIDEDNDGTIEYSGASSLIDVFLNKGNHTVYIETIDQCGNSASCSYKVTAQDCKNPTPYCISNITTVIMPSSKEITLNAKQFDFDSYDNCTMQSDLLFSFTSDVRDSIKSFTCEDIADGVAGLISLTIYVTDEAQNQDFCAIDLAIQDNNDVCEDQGTLTSLTGRVASDKDRGIKGAIISISSDVEVYNQSKLTGEDGIYTFNSLPTSVPFEVTVKHEGDIGEEVSTFDLIVLQRHILGLAPLTSPYQVIAGDANGSNKLNVSDLVAIRKVLLGITDEFAPGVPSWRFIDADQEFPDVKNPWNYKEVKNMGTLSSSGNEANMVAIKIGDVNSSIGSFKSETPSENRNNYGTWTKNIQDGTTTVSVNSDMELDGFQITLRAPDAYKVVFSDRIKAHSQFAFNGDLVTIICYLPEVISLSKEEVLLSIKGDISIEPKGRFALAPELYTNNEPISLKLKEVEHKTQSHTPTFSMYTVGNEVIFPTELHESKGKFTMFDMEGRVVEVFDYNGQSNHLIAQPQGFYIIRLHLNNGTIISLKTFISE